MENKKISEFLVDDRIEGFYVIKSIEYKTASNGNKFIDITLSDDTGEVNAKLWDCKDDDMIFIQNNLVKIRGDIVEWQGKKQIRIAKMRYANEEDGISIEDLVQSAPYKPEAMYNTVLDYIDTIQNEDIKKIVKHILYENKEKIIYYPAAKQNHHAIRSGLLYHILRMLMTAERLVEVYPNVNRDLVFAGVILHDIAKLDEMDANELGIVSEYTVEGQLLGHIIQGIKSIDRTAKLLEIDNEVSMLLQHMILSHHYEAEFGSPKKPMIPEAELLHYIDIIDARMYDMEKALSSVNSNEFTDKIWSLDNRKLYKTSLEYQTIDANKDDIFNEPKKICVLDKDEIFKDKSLI
jgi:3'-5' exoribonuclease